MRLIDADELCEDVDNYEFTKHSDYSNVRDMIDYAPTIDAEPVKHGRWIQLDRDIAVCSECGRHENALLVDSYPYCHCGAKMDEKHEGKSADACFTDEPGNPHYV